MALPTIVSWSDISGNYRYFVDMDVNQWPTLTICHDPPIASSNYFFVIRSEELVPTGVDLTEDELVSGGISVGGAELCFSRDTMTLSAVEVLLTKGSADRVAKYNFGIVNSPRQPTFDSAFWAANLVVRKYMRAASLPTKTLLLDDSFVSIWYEGAIKWHQLSDFLLLATNNREELCGLALVDINEEVSKELKELTAGSR